MISQRVLAWGVLCKLLDRSNQTEAIALTSVIKGVQMELESRCLTEAAEVDNCDDKILKHSREPHVVFGRTLDPLDCHEMQGSG